MDAWKPVIYPLLKSAGVLAQLVRALACHARGRGFESRTSRHSSSHEKPDLFGLFLTNGVLAQLVRALACHARGRGFESRTSRHSMNTVRLAGLFLFLATIMLPLRGHSCGPIFRIILPTWLASL